MPKLSPEAKAHRKEVRRTVLLLVEQELESIREAIVRISRSVELNAEHLTKGDYGKFAEKVENLMDSDEFQELHGMLDPDIT